MIDSDKEQLIWKEITLAMDKVKKVRKIAEDDGVLLSKGHIMFGKCLAKLEDIRRVFGE